MDKTELQKSLAAYRDNLNRRTGARDTLLQEISAGEARVRENQQEVILLEQAGTLLNLAGDYARHESKESIERLVTNALGMVFQGDLKFEVEMEERGSRVEADFFVSSTYGGTIMVRNEPSEARGGGVVDVIAMALRIALLETSRPPVDGPLILDEPGKHVSEEFALQVAGFLSAVCQSFGRQVIMVTHNQHLAGAGEVSYQVEIRNGESIVSRRGALP